jgi:hypothetical protein
VTDDYDSIRQAVDGIVGTQEVEARRIVGDKRYDQAIAMYDRRVAAESSILEARARLLVALGTAFTLGSLIMVALAIWFMVR